MTTRDLFETTECSRCGGSGHYSYCQTHGTMCFGCLGKGTAFTRDGQAALDAWRVAYTRTVLVQDVTAGMKVMARCPLSNRERVVTVESSGPDELNPGQNRWTLRYVYPNPLGLGSDGTFIDSEVRLPASADEKKAAYQSVSHMPGAVGEWS